MKNLITVINSETYRKLEKAARARNMNVDDAMAYIATHGIASFLSLDGGVHHSK